MLLLRKQYEKNRWSIYEKFTKTKSFRNFAFLVAPNLQFGDFEYKNLWFVFFFALKMLILNIAALQMRQDGMCYHCGRLDWIIEIIAHHGVTLLWSFRYGGWLDRRLICLRSQRNRLSKSRRCRNRTTLRHRPTAGGWVSNRSWNENQDFRGVWIQASHI